MNHRPKFLALVFLLALTLVFAACKPSASPAVEPLPDDTTALDESAEMQELAAGNSTDDVEPTAGATDMPMATDEATPEATLEIEVEPTLEPTEVVVTIEPTLEPEPTEAAATPEVVVVIDETPEPELISVPGKHIVQPGENLFRIALNYGLSVEALAQANGITNAALIYVGQELQVPSGSQAPSDPTTPPVQQPGGDVVHIVQPGENLFRIALKYNYDQFYIARYNNISNLALIYPGQSIRIP